MQRHSRPSGMSLAAASYSCFTSFSNDCICLTPSYFFSSIFFNSRCSISSSLLLEASASVPALLLFVVLIALSRLDVTFCSFYHCLVNLNIPCTNQSFCKLLCPADTFNCLYSQFNSVTFYNFFMNWDGPLHIWIAMMNVQQGLDKLWQSCILVTTTMEA